MIKEAIEKVEELVRSQIVTVDGAKFYSSEGEYKQIIPEIPSPNRAFLTSLDAIVKMIRNEAVKQHDKVYVEVNSHKSVVCFTGAMGDKRWDRWELYQADATDVPGWKPEESFGFEDAAIALQTRFQRTGDLEYTLQLLSQITTGAKVTYNDIGVATTVVSQKGISLQQNQTIRPIVNLRPYRTFQEVEQPEGKFLIRISERGIRFIEADGGMWKLEARNTVKAYLEDALKAEVEAGSVVVML